MNVAEKKITIVSWSANLKAFTMISLYGMFFDFLMIEAVTAIFLVSDYDNLTTDLHGVL